MCALLATVDKLDDVAGGGAIVLGTPNGGKEVVIVPDDVDETCDDAEADCLVKTFTTSKNIQTSYQTCSAEYAISSVSE
jgi:hypothetical protein